MDFDTLSRQNLFSKRSLEKTYALGKSCLNFLRIAKDPRVKSANLLSKIRKISSGFHDIILDSGTTDVFIETRHSWVIRNVDRRKHTSENAPVRP